MSKDDFKNKIELLKQIPIVDYCNQKGIVLHGNGRWLHLEDHNSLVIDSVNNSFIWNSKGTFGDIINFVQAYYNVDFKTAVKELSGQNLEELIHSEQKDAHSARNGISKKSNRTPTKFELDEIEGKYSRMYAYLIQNRGISKRTIDEFAYKKLISQDTKGNINFKFKDEDGNISFVKKGTTDIFFEYINPQSDIRGFRFTRNKNPEKVERLAVYESPIDLMSYIDMFGTNSKTAYCAMFGLKHNNVLSNIKDYPNLKELCLCVDNDAGGLKFIAKIKEMARSEPLLQDITITAVIPEHLKDWNDMLKNKKANQPGNTIIVSDLTPSPVEVLNKAPVNNTNKNKSEIGIVKTVEKNEIEKKIEHGLSKLNRNIKTIEKNKQSYSR